MNRPKEREFTKKGNESRTERETRQRERKRYFLLHPQGKLKNLIRKKSSRKREKFSQDVVIVFALMLSHSLSLSHLGSLQLAQSYGGMVISKKH